MAKPPPVETWWPKLYWLASTYKIGIIHVPVTHWDCVCGPIYNDVDENLEFMTRPGHGFDVARRRVFLLHEDRQDHWNNGKIEREVERDLHELCHIICQAPWCGADDVGEDWMLMQVERCIARALFWPRNERAYRSIVNWQEVTASQFYDNELGMVDNYTHTTMWKDGMARGRSIGLLNDRNEPTWRMPRWSRMPKRLRSIKDHQPPDRW